MSSSEMAGENSPGGSTNSAGSTETESIGTSPSSRGQLTPFRLGCSRIAANEIQDYINRSYLTASDPPEFRPPGDEEYPQPRPYEAVVFRDYFVAGLKFPLDDFVAGVLERFSLQLHQLTPNAIARLGVFAFSVKMQGGPLSVDAFARFCTLHWSPSKTEEGESLEFGSYNFVPRNSRCTVSIAHTYKNKWGQWQQYWFYHRVCSDSDVASARANGLSRASVLVSELVPFVGEKKPRYSLTGLAAVQCGEAFALTGRFQTSRDIVEEWTALYRAPLCLLTRFETFVEVDGYGRPDLECHRPSRFPNDLVFVHFVEERANMVCGKRMDKEEEAKDAALGGKKRLNRAFELMCVEYEDRPPFKTVAPTLPAALAVPAAGTVRDDAQLRAARAAKRKAPEADDVSLGRLTAKAERQSKTFVLSSDFALADLDAEGQVRSAA